MSFSRVVEVYREQGLEEGEYVLCLSQDIESLLLSNIGALWSQVLNMAWIYIITSLVLRLFALD